MVLVLLLFLSFLPFPALSGQCNVLYQLDDMSYCRMNRPFDIYRNYGCSCSGYAPSKPIDGIDKCCQDHIACYDAAISSGSCENHNAPFYCLYKWSCLDRTCHCNNSNNCMQIVCQCDDQFIECLAKYPYPSYSRKCPYYPEK